MDHVARRLVVGLAAFWLGCAGEIADQAPDGPAAPNQGSPSGAGGTPGQPAPSPPIGQGGAPAASCDRAAQRPLRARLWRLSDEQHAAAIASLLPGVSVPPVITPGRNGGDFISLADGLAVSAPMVRAYQEAAKSAATQATAKVETLLACAAGQAERACAEAFVDRFASRAFRRPLETMERTQLLALFDNGRMDGVATGVRVVIEAVLQSPSFLFRQELGAGPRGELTAFELASALSFTFTGTIPDPELWAAAQDGSLTKPAVLEKQVDRLLALPNVREQLVAMLVGWAGLTDGVHGELSSATYPDYDEAMRTSMHQEVIRFMQRLVAERGTVRDLLVSRTTSVDAKVASVYGVPHTGTAPKNVMLPMNQRAGIMTTPGLLASLAGPQPVVHRGLFMRARLLCGDLPSPPEGLDTNQKVEGSTERQLADKRAANPVCGSCHALMDPLGLALSNYDHIGRYRTSELGKPVDASGQLTATDVDGPFTNGVELMERLAGSPQVAACMTKNLMSAMLGTDLRTEPACAPAATTAPLVDIVRAIALSPMFRERTRE